MVSNLSFGVVVLCLFGGFILSFLNISRSVQRRVYWTLACTAGVSGIFLKYPTWDDAAVLGLFPLVTMAFMAYAFTPYIKIGGKIYSLTITDPDPEDAPASDAGSTEQESDPNPGSYSGFLTAPTMWWMLVVIAVIAAGNVYGFAVGKGDAWVAVTAATLLALLAVGIGYGDASWRYPVARGQYIQFGVASVITAGSFALVYFTAYCIAQRRPLRREQSLERQAHPRHGKRET